MEGAEYGDLEANMAIISAYARTSLAKTAGWLAFDGGIARLQCVS